MSKRTFRTGDGGGSSALNVTHFDDFVSFQTIEDSSGADDFLGSGNFVSQPVTAIPVDSEANHPGIIQLSSTGTGGGQTLWGFTFTDITNPSVGTIFGLTFENDFDVTWLSRLNYSVAATFNNTWRMDATVDGISVDISDTTVTVGVNGVFTPTAVPVPATGVWFKVRFLYTGGLLNIYLDNNLLYSAVTVLTGACNMRLENQSFSGGIDTLTCDTDYVSTNYTVAR